MNFSINWRALRSIWLTLLLAMVLPASALAGDFSVTLIGTGGPPPDPNRRGPSVLVEVGDQKLLFDVGRGATMGLIEAKVPLGSVDAVFITHMHPDHIYGLVDFWLTGYLPAAYARRQGRLRVHGPAGLSKFLAGLEVAYEKVLIDWSVPNMNAKSTQFLASEFEREGLVYEKAGVRVTAIRVNHVPNIPSYGYRIDYQGKTVVISGDTAFSQNLIRHSQGADLIVHEIFYADPTHHSAAFLEKLASKHTTPDEAARVFAAIKPAAAVLTHISSNATADIVLGQIARNYDGNVFFGADDMRFEIGDTIEVARSK